MAPLNGHLEVNTQSLPDRTSRHSALERLVRGTPERSKPVIPQQHTDILGTKLIGARAPELTQPHSHTPGTHRAAKRPPQSGAGASLAQKVFVQHGP